MQTTVDVDGLALAVKALEGVDGRVSLRVLRGALRYAMKPAIARAKQLVPYDTSDDADEYHLRDSIGIKAEAKKSRAGNATVMRFGAQRQTLTPGHPSGYVIAGGLSKKKTAPNHAVIVNDKKPFLEPAVESTQPQIVSRFGEKIVKAVKKL